MDLDELDDRDLTDILKKHIRINEFDTTLDKFGGDGVTVYVSRIRRDIKRALTQRTQELQTSRRGRNQEL